MSTSEMIFGTLKDTGSKLAETGSTYMLPIIGTLVIIAIIAVSVIVSLQYQTKRPAKELLGPIDMFAPSSPVIVDRATITSTMMASYTLSMYFMIDAVPDMRSSSTPLLTWPGVWTLNYNAPKEELLWTFAGNEAVHVKHIPLQRWNQIVMTQEGRTVDLYCNGALVSSTTLNNVPALPNASITIVPSNVMGRVAYIQAWSRRLTVGEVAANYVETSDSQGRPYIGQDLFKAFKSLPNLFCPNGQCGGTDVPSGEGLRWEFPYQ